MPRVIRGRQTRPNSEVASTCDYWNVTITIPFLDSIISEMESRFAEDKRAHFELCALIPEVIREQDVQAATCNILSSKWKHLLPEEGNFESKLARWKVHCNGIFGERSITKLLCQMLIQSSFPMYRSYFVSWWYFVLAVQKLRGHFPAYD